MQNKCVLGVRLTIYMLQVSVKIHFPEKKKKTLKDEYFKMNVKCCFLHSINLPRLPNESVHTSCSEAMGDAQNTTLS